jgi:hypothetical protein
MPTDDQQVDAAVGGLLGAGEGAARPAMPWQPAGARKRSDVDATAARQDAGSGLALHPGCR